MKLLKLINRLGLPLSVLDINTWLDIEVSRAGFTPSQREGYERYKAAITRVVRDRAAVSAAARAHGLDASELDRKLERCLQIAPDGAPYGFRALVPYLRIKELKRKEGTKTTAGLFTELMDRFPAINNRLWEEYKRGESLEQLKKLLLEELLPEVGWPEHKYPYKTAREGVEALRAHLKRRENEAAAEDWEEQGPNEERYQIIRPFAQVQLDAHRCDAHFTIHAEGPEGLWRTLVLERIWLLVLLDVGGRAALGYALSLNRQCNISDVLEAIHTGVVPQPVRNLTVSGLAYRPGAGFPNQLIPLCAYQKFDVICLDNAMAHRSERLHQILNEKLQCQVRLNRAGKPNDNQFVERFFATLTAHGCKRTVSSTGSGPKDEKRTDSEREAERYEFTLSHAEELLDVLIANYNVETNRGIYSAPLDYIRSYYRDLPALTRHVPESERSGFSLRELWEEGTVRGDAKGRERPFVFWLDGKYRADFLTTMPDLIGKDVMLLVAVDDVRSIKAYLPDGRYLGVLRVSGRWALTKHSLKTRRLIIALARKGVLHIGYRDPVRALRAHLEEESKTSKAARNQLERLLREMNGEEAASLPDTTEAPAEPFHPSRSDWISLRTPVYD